MDFINTAINIKDIPHTADVTLQPIHKDYLKILRFEWMLTTAVLAVAGGLFIFFNPATRSSSWWLIIIAVVITLSAAYYFIQEKSFPYRAFAVRDKDVIYQKGWIIRNTTICPFNRIQNCSVLSGPLERKFELASLVVYTAGTVGGDLRINGLLLHEAENLRHFILDKIHTEIHEAV